MFGHAAKSGRFHYYVCATAYRNGNQTCGMRPISRAKVEDQIPGKIRQLILREEHLEQLVLLTNRELEASLIQVKERLYDALENDKVCLDDLAPRIKELKQKRDLLLRARSETQETLASGQMELVNRELVLVYLRDLNGVLELGTVAERRAFLRTFVQSIEKHNSQVTIHCTLPIPPERAPVDLLGVLDLDSLGGAEGIRTRGRAL